MTRGPTLVLLALCLTALPLGGALDPPTPAPHAVADDHARLWTAQERWAWPATPHAVPLCFWFTNEADHTLWMPDSAPWRIEDADGQVVYGPIALTALFPLYPGESQSGCWSADQLFMGAPAPAGGYDIVWSYYTDDTWSELRELRLPVVLALAP